MGSVYATVLLVAFVGRLAHAQSNPTPTTRPPIVIDADVQCGDSLLVDNRGRPNYVNEPSGDVVFRWVFTQGGPWDITTCFNETNFDTFLSVYADAELTELLFLDDDPSGGSCNFSRLHAILRSTDGPAYNLQPGVYYIVLDGYGFISSTGDARLAINCAVRPSILECGNCLTIDDERVGCNIPAVEECVCGFDSFCCGAGGGNWDQTCVDTCTDRLMCNFTCTTPAPDCTTEPVVANAAPFTMCDPTLSRQDCIEKVRCLPATTQWGINPFCFGGSWTFLPACTRPVLVHGHLWFVSHDGLLFSYHKTGVIRMWDSPENDMELQIRTLRPEMVSCDATLTGQVAFRAADQLITVVGSQDVFEVRFNGVVQTLVPGTEYNLGSGPNALLVEHTPTSLSITSKRGAIIQIIFYESTGMSWLAVPHTLNPAVFSGNTRGLLGVLDGDATNDFTTRDGTVLPVVSFDDSNGEQAEFGNSWIMSDSESLFGPEEDAIAAADPQYSLNPPGNPSIECPTEFPNASIPECDALDPQLINACYFDVVLGGEQFLADVVYQPPCGNNTDQYCSYHGSCVNDTCVCTDGWSGSDCEIRICPTACTSSAGSTGACRDDGLCDCLPGFTGATCEKTADCSMISDCFAASGQGTCIDDNLCECSSIAYVQPNCSIPQFFPFVAVPVPRPTRAPRPVRTEVPTPSPMSTDAPTPEQTLVPTPEVTAVPTEQPTEQPTAIPTDQPTAVPTPVPTIITDPPSEVPTVPPTPVFTDVPTEAPTDPPTQLPSAMPTPYPTIMSDPPSEVPTERPNPVPTVFPTPLPTVAPEPVPTGPPLVTFTATVDPTVTFTATVPPPTASPTPEPPRVGRIAINTCASSTSEGTCETELQEVTRAVVCCRDVTLYYYGWHGYWSREVTRCTDQRPRPWWWYQWGSYGHDDSDLCYSSAATFEEAEQFCEDLVHDGRRDWRLCTADEIVDDGDGNDRDGGACCRRRTGASSGGNSLMTYGWYGGGGKVECHQDTPVWTSDECVVPPPGSTDACECSAAIEAAVEEVLATFTGDFDAAVAEVLATVTGGFEAQIAAEVTRQLQAAGTP